MYKYAGIIVNNTSIKLDKLFIYKIPDALYSKITIGFRVKVPFGKGNRLIEGYVLELYENYKDDINIKKIYSMQDNIPVLGLKEIQIIKFMREKYLSTYLESIKAVLPGGIIKGMKNKTEALLWIDKRLEGKFDKEPYISIFNCIKNNNGMYNKNRLKNDFNFSLSSINTLLKHEFLKQENTIINRYNQKSYKTYDKKELNIEQKKALDTILKNDCGIFLLHGVTGSGKTEIYMHLVSKMLNEGKDSIILVPEISLTPQMVERFKGRFGKDITVFHSRLSDGERYDEWLRVKEGKVKVAIGARSAIFLPFNNLGLVVVDEEHESSYKSESDPKYDAREVAEYLCIINKCRLVLGTATPSIESYFRCKKGEIDLIEINNRADDALMPEVEVVDMRRELENNNKSIFSYKLYENIKNALEKKEQIILFLNRRGFSTFVSCRKCGLVFKCRSCDVSLTYHNDSGMLVCHYCGNRQKMPKICPKCGSKYVKYFGIGTEKVEQEIKKYFPESRIIRMDFDTTRKKNSYENIYNTFKEGRADILVGTQMLAKGLDFKNVTVVGVIAADLSLNLPDFRSAERTFQLITQVSGRAGRGEKPGRVIIQTYNPENYSIKCASQSDYEGFYKEEIDIRKDMVYPPFCELLLINLSSKNENLLIKSIQKIGILLKNNILKDDSISILGPCPCEISKIKDMFRWQIIAKGKIDRDMALKIRYFVYEQLEDVHNDIRVSLDINPNSLL